MTEKKRAPKGARKAVDGFTEEEKAAARDRVRELRARARGGKVDGERDVREKIAGMQGRDRELAERLHTLIHATAPTLSPKTWYGMPAYAKDDQIVCYFQPAAKFKARYAFLGFSDEAHLDEGNVWPISFAITELTPADEARIVALVKKAVS